MEDLLTFLTTGKYLAAVGAALVLVVGLARAGLAKKWPWFATQYGGYALAWGTTSIAYVGTALVQGQLPSLHLLQLALAAGFMASGIYTHWQDLLDAAKSVPPTIAKTGIVLAVLLCGSCGLTSSKPVQDVVDCTKGDQTAIATAEAACLTFVPDWSKVGNCALGALEKVGETNAVCVIADIVQQYLTSKSVVLAPPEKQSGAHQLLEQWRKDHAHGASIHTAHGNL